MWGAFEVTRDCFYLFIFPFVLFYLLHHISAVNVIHPFVGGKKTVLSLADSWIRIDLPFSSLFHGMNT
jgi:hypothetical protein